MIRVLVTLIAVSFICAAPQRGWAQAAAPSVPVITADNLYELTGPHRLVGLSHYLEEMQKTSADLENQIFVSGVEDPAARKMFEDHASRYGAMLQEYNNVKKLLDWLAQNPTHKEAAAVLVNVNKRLGPYETREGKLPQASSSLTLGSLKTAKDREVSDSINKSIATSSPIISSIGIDTSDVEHTPSQKAKKQTIHHFRESDRRRNGGLQTGLHKLKFGD